MAAPDTDRPKHRPAEDPFHIDSTPSLSSAGRDFKPSPLGRSVVTALEAQLEKVSNTMTMTNYTPLPSLFILVCNMGDGLKPASQLWCVHRRRG